MLPASIDLAGSEVVLATKVGREHALARALAPIRSRFDVILIDCPPSLGILTINGLTAADAVLIPLQCETLSHRGVGQLLETVADVRAYTQPDLAVLGAVATMFDGRSRHPREIAADVASRYDVRVFEPAVPRSIRFAEAPATGASILEHAPNSRARRRTARSRRRCSRPSVSRHPSRTRRRLRRGTGLGVSAGDGKRALFSTAVRRPGTLVVECGACHGRTRLTYIELDETQSAHHRVDAVASPLAVRALPRVRAAHAGSRPAGSSRPVRTPYERGRSGPLRSRRPLRR